MTLPPRTRFKWRYAPPQPSSSRAAPPPITTETTEATETREKKNNTKDYLKDNNIIINPSMNEPESLDPLNNDINNIPLKNRIKIKLNKSYSFPIIGPTKDKNNKINKLKTSFSTIEEDENNNNTSKYYIRNDLNLKKKYLMKTTSNLYNNSIDTIYRIKSNVKRPNVPFNRKYSNIKRNKDFNIVMKGWININDLNDNKKYKKLFCILEKGLICKLYLNDIIKNKYVKENIQENDIIQKEELINNNIEIPYKIINIKDIGKIDDTISITNDYNNKNNDLKLRVISSNEKFIDMYFNTNENYTKWRIAFEDEIAKCKVSKIRFVTTAKAVSKLNFLASKHTESKHVLNNHSKQNKQNNENRQEIENTHETKETQDIDQIIQIRHSGWLHKKTNSFFGGKKMDRRYFVLKDTNISYYDVNLEGRKAEGYGTVINIKRWNEEENGLEIVLFKKNSFFIKSKTKEDIDKWSEMFLKVLEKET